MFSINCKGRLLSLETPKIMGIINATPDSFFAESRRQTEDAVLTKAGQLLTAGAAILDLGGQSTRPGSVPIAPGEEADRVLPAITAIAAEFPDAIISIDTYYASVAEAAVGAGAALINDVSAGNLDPQLWPAVARLGVPYVLMHMQGAPQTMQQAPTYTNVVIEVFDTLNQQLATLQRLGITDIIVDPGFGFGKTIAHNFQLLSQLSYFRELGRPLLLGLSRKGTIYKTLSITPEEALNGTTVLHTIGLLQGANLLRVHDVKEANEAIRLVTAYEEAAANLH